MAPGRRIPPDLTAITKWEQAKDERDYENYDAFKTGDGEALEGDTLELARMIKKGIDGYTIYTPVPTMTYRFFTGATGAGKLLNKCLNDLPKRPIGYKEIGAESLAEQMAALAKTRTPYSGTDYKESDKWLCTSDKVAPNGDGSYTRTVQFMCVDNVEDRLYESGFAPDGGLE